MKARILLSSLFVSSAMLMNAQISLPYTADWKYAAGGFEQDGEKGKPTSNHDLYDLGGWDAIKTAGSRPFYIAISSGSAAVNTLEFTDATQDPTRNTSWLISPAFDFSANTDKNIAFKCGLEKIDARTSNLELLYSTDYAGNAETATWISLKTNLIPDTQVGLATTKMEQINFTLPIVAEKVFVAIKADKVEGQTATVQAKIRVTDFKVSETAKSILETIPFAGAWHYKEEIVKADSTLDTSLDANAGKYNGDKQYYNLGGWTLENTEGSRTFFLSMSSSKPIPNTLEFLDDKQKTPTTSWIISPAIDFSGNEDKFVSFYCGKEAADQQSSNIDLLYSLDYDGNAAEATWTTITSKAIPAAQSGLNELTMNLVEEKLMLNTPKVVFAIRVSKDGAEGAKQAKLRVKHFQINTESITTGIENITSSKEVSIYPNPVNDNLNIVDASSVTRIEIFSITGKKEMEISYPAASVSVSHLAPGSYIARIETTNGIIKTVSIIKK